MVFIPINKETASQTPPSENTDVGNNRYAFPSQPQNTPTQKIKPQFDPPSHDQNTNKFFGQFRKVTSEHPSSPPTTGKQIEPTAQVLPYEFRPGSLNIFGEVTNDDDTAGNAGNGNAVEENFKYESENDLESIIKVPSDFASGMMIFIVGVNTMF